MKDKKDYSHEIAAEQYLASKDYISAEKEFLAVDHAVLACMMWFYEGNIERARKLAEDADRKGEWGARSMLRAINFGFAGKYYDKKLGGRKMLEGLNPGLLESIILAEKTKE